MKDVHIMVGVITIIVLFIFTLYLVQLCSIVVHEAGHWFFRRLFGVPTDVFIGRGKHYIPIAPGWWFNPKLLLGVNYPASVPTLKNDLRVPIILRAGAWTHFIIALVLDAVWCLLPKGNVYWTTFVSGFTFAAVFGLPINLIPRATVKGSSKQTVKSVEQLVSLVLNGEELVAINDGMWIRVWKYSRAHPEKHQELQEFLDKAETFPELTPIFRKYANSCKRGRKTQHV